MRRFSILTLIGFFVVLANTIFKNFVSLFLCSALIFNPLACQAVVDNSSLVNAATSSHLTSVEQPFNHDIRVQQPASSTISKEFIAKSSRLSEARIVHILEGDRTGGGHGPGRGVPGKSEFPMGWSDEQVIDYIKDVIQDPNSRWRRQARLPGKPQRWSVEGRRDGIDIKVIVEPDGEGIITAFPTNVPRNP
ncbi:MAG: EndoU domain-containing protein [Microcoleaceae cyanobacterium]